MAISSLISWHLILLPGLVAAILVGFCINGVATDTGSYYKAGVVEFNPCLQNPGETVPELILRNADRYIQIINLAQSHAVDILVFPENGLNRMGLPSERDKIFPYLTKLPEPGVTPCDDANVAEVLKRLSCAAKRAQLYLVINLSEIVKCQPTDPGCPNDQSLFYNSNLVFDRSGKIISKYRKFNLYYEPQFNITAESEFSVFETDFGVKFGMFICADILFKKPALELVTQKGVTDIIFSVAWFSELPIAPALSIQSAWSYANNINLLASGYNNPQNANTGSGIHVGVNGTLVAVILNNTQTQLLVAKVPIRSNPLFDLTEGIIIDVEDNCTQKESGLKFYQTNFTGYQTKIITSGENSFIYIKDSFKCDIKLNYSDSLDSSHIVYRYVAFDGLKDFGAPSLTYIEVCGIMSCLNSTLDSCGLRPVFNHLTKSVFNEVFISMKSSNHLSYFPITLNKDLLPISVKDYVFTHDPKHNLHYHLDLTSSHDDLISFLILGWL